jgi:hypothetical protein
MVTGDQILARRSVLGNVLNNGRLLSLQAVEWMMLLGGAWQVCDFDAVNRKASKSISKAGNAA